MELGAPGIPVAEKLAVVVTPVTEAVNALAPATVLKVGVQVAIP